MSVWVVAVSIAAPAYALEAFELYDNFDAPVIDPDKWPNQRVRVRELIGNKLHLVAREYGGRASTVGTVGSSWVQAAPNAGKVTAIRSTITVSRVQAKGCAANSQATQARARIYLQPFNAATRSPGSMVNDVFAQVVVSRRSDSTDASNVLRVEGLMHRCDSADCERSTFLDSVDLGVVKLGKAVVAQLEWDEPNDRFLFRRDKLAKRSLSYTVSDAEASGVAIAHVGLRNIVANCTASAASGLVDATFDDVYLNASATP